MCIAFCLTPLCIFVSFVDILMPTTSLQPSIKFPFPLYNNAQDALQYAP